MPIKPHNTEEEYFARENALRREKIAKAEAKKAEEAKREELKKLHWMHCPKCGLDLETTHFRGIEVETCRSCKGVWLDHGDIEQAALEAPESEKKSAWVRAVLGIFEPSKKSKK